MGNTLYIIVPCYNEEAVLPETATRLREKMAALMRLGKISGESRVVLVNDGSSDRTWELISMLAEADALFAGIALSGNRGHQNALLCGLMSVRGMADMVISMDADLQDDIDAMDRMVDAYLEGSDIVYGVRGNREKDSFFKRFTAEGYYRLLEKLGCRVVFNHADYRLLSARALDALALYGEQELFLRGIVPMLGFQTATVVYERGERFAGESKYPLKKMLALAASGAASLTLKPLRMILTAGLALLALSFLLLIGFIVGAILGHTMLGWRILLVSVWGAAGLILTALGIVGEYAGRAFMEAKGRPRYIVGSTVGIRIETEKEERVNCE